MCSSDPNLMTTCEIDGNTPDKEKYDCGCIKDRCGWYLKQWKTKKEKLKLGEGVKDPETFKPIKQLIKTNFKNEVEML